jgi:hypothetical protein
MDAPRAAQLSVSKVYEVTAVETGETPLQLVPRRTRRAAPPLPSPPVLTGYVSSLAPY